MNDRHLIKSQSTRQRIVQLAAIYLGVGLIYISYYPILLRLGGSGTMDALYLQDGRATDYNLFTIGCAILFGLPLAFVLVLTKIGQARSLTYTTVREPSNAIHGGVLVASLCLSLYIWVEAQGKFEGTANRANRTSVDYLLTQNSVVSILVAQAAVLVSIACWKKTTFSSRMLTWMLAGNLLLIDVVLLGGRRTILPIVLAAAFQSGMIRRALNSVWRASLLLAAAVSFLLFGAVREYIFHNEAKYLTFVDAGQLALESNEFQEVGYGVYNVTKFTESAGLYRGETYLKFWTIFIPRSLWQDKPISLTYTTGAMVSPMSEAYLNFGLNGLWIILIGSTALAFIVWKSSDGFLQVSLCAYSFDQMRTGSSELVYVAAILACIYLVTTRRSRYIIAR